MEQEGIHRLDRLTCQLAETLMNAAFCVEEIRAVVRVEIDVKATGHIGGQPTERTSANASRPILCESTLRVSWKGRSLHLGNTVSFRLLGRLARRPNQYVTHLDLLHDVWDDEDLETGTIRSMVRHLRRKLRDGGMGGLAHAIRGHNGRYILEL